MTRGDEPQEGFRLLFGALAGGSAGARAAIVAFWWLCRWRALDRAEADAWRVGLSAGGDQGGASFARQAHAIFGLKGAPSLPLLAAGGAGFAAALPEADREQFAAGNAFPRTVEIPRERVSTAAGREEAMALVHAVATSPDHAVAPAVNVLNDPQASGEALRHVLVGGVHSVEAFAAEVAEAEGGDPLPPHQATKIIGEVLAELDR